VTLDHGLLYRVQRAVAAAQAFDGEQRPAIERGQQLDAGRCRAHPQLIVVADPGDHHHAGAAIAFRAALLGAFAAQRLAQVIEYRGRRLAVADLDEPAVEQESCRPGHHRHSSRRRITSPIEDLPGWPVRLTYR
jgi:hypothetical protein